MLVARGEPPLQRTPRECEAAGAASTLVVPADVGDDAEVEKLLIAVTSQHGRIDAVVHCAGVVAYGRTEEVPADVFEGVLRTNLTARSTWPGTRSRSCAASATAHSCCSAR